MRVVVGSCSGVVEGFLLVVVHRVPGHGAWKRHSCKRTQDVRVYLHPAHLGMTLIQVVTFL